MHACSELIILGLVCSTRADSFEVFFLFIAIGTELIFFVLISNILLCGGSLWNFFVPLTLVLVLVSLIQISQQP